MKKKLYSLLLICVLGTVLIGCGFKHPEPVTRNAVAMGTIIRLSLWDRENMNEEASALLKRIDALDKETLSWREAGSEVSRFNESQNGMQLSNTLAEAVQISLELSARTNGALDLTLRPVIALWGIEDYDGKTDYTPPSEAELSAAICGYGHMTFTDARTLTKDDPAVQLDFGAVGKGYALDIAASEINADGAVLAAGGSVLVYGTKGADFEIGIRAPEGLPTEYLGILKIKGEKGKKSFISTSGGYEKQVKWNGQVFEHIIDGRSRRPAESELLSATVITYDSGLISDGLSTACYILGVNASLDLLKEYNAEAIFVSRDHTVTVTNGIRDSFSLTASGYTLGELPE